MSTSEKNILKTLMKKYLDRSCTEEERSELINHIKNARNADEMDVLWQEVWENTGDTDRYEELNWEDLLQIEAETKHTKTRIIRHRIWRWSAAAAVLFGLFFMVQWWTEGNALEVYQTGYGENIEIALDDGTRIYLNANSRLVWNTNWQEKGIRRATLEGEAFFDVSHINMHAEIGQSSSESENDQVSRLPFEVKTTDLTIRVLGTSFNAVQRRGKTEVFLEEGKVELALHRTENLTVMEVEETPIAPGDDNNIERVISDEETDDNVVTMLPGEWVSYSSTADKLIQKTIDKIEPLTEWKDGTLSYHDVEFRVMLENLEDIYGKKFEVIDSALLEKRVNVGVPYKDWKTVTDMMEWMLDIEITESDDNHVRIQKRKEN